MKETEQNEIKKTGEKFSKIYVIIKLVIFVVCVGLTVYGQRHIGIPGLLTMLAGLAGILILLYIYNKKYQ